MAESTPDDGNRSLSREDVISLIRDETGDIKRVVEETSNRLEQLERRVNSSYVKAVNVCNKALPAKSDWLAGFRKMIQEIGLVTEEQASSHILRLDVASSRPKSNVYVVEVHECLRRKIITPNTENRRLIESYCTKIGKGKKETIRFYPKMTKEEETTRNKTRYYVEQMIRYYESTGKTNYMVKVPNIGRLDRIIRESKERVEGSKREFLSYDEVAKAIGSKVELIDEQYELMTKKRKEAGASKVGKRGSEEISGNEAKRHR